MNKTMRSRKYWFLSFLLFWSLGFVACSDDDETLKDAEKEAEMVGTWEVASYYSNVTMPGSEPVVTEDANPDMQLTFNADYSGTASTGAEFTWALEGDELTVTFIQDEEAQGPPAGGDDGYGFEFVAGLSYPIGFEIVRFDAGLLDLKFAYTNTIGISVLVELALEK